MRRSTVSSFAGLLALLLLSGFVTSGLSALMPAILMRTGTEAGAAILAPTLLPLRQRRLAAAPCF